MIKKLELELDSLDSSLDDFNCKLYRRKNELLFAYPSIDRETINRNNRYSKKINLYRIDILTKKSIRDVVQFTNQETYKTNLKSSRDWMFKEIGGGTKLDTGILIDVDSMKIDLVSKSTSEPNSDRVKSSYSFDNYKIRYNQKSTVECLNVKTKETIWKSKIKGYLYTPIERKNNFLFWGTAGNGGCFYCVDIDSGKEIMRFCNTDSSNYNWYKETILLRDKTGNLARIDPYKNLQIENIKLKGAIVGNQITIIDNDIFVVSHDLKNKRSVLNWIEVE